MAFDALIRLPQPSLRKLPKMATLTPHLSLEEQAVDPEMSFLEVQKSQLFFAADWSVYFQPFNET
jgi:hypothetical protein